MEKFSGIKINQNLLDKKNSRLELVFKGKDVNYVIVNSLRRSCLSDIPIYAFDTIEFGDNSSVFNNDYMRHRIRSIPIKNIENDVVFFEREERKTELPVEDETTENLLLDENANIAMGSDNILIEEEIEKATDDTYDMLNMHVDIENKNDDVLSVTTDQAKFYKNGEEIKSIYKNPMLLCKLNKNQKISFTAIAKLGIERISALFSPVSIFAYTEVKQDEFKVAVESRGQLTEYRILHIACMNLLKHLEAFLDSIPRDNKGLNGELDIKNMSHTMGNLIAHGMLRHKDVEFAGYAKPHLLDERIVIKFVLKKSNIYNVVAEVVDYFKALFTYLAKEFEKK
ncbi:RNA polymerase Rpb3/Rpb11 dimerisation domain [seawater metagenome]|uniref:RNA polymerase Rpb3/Rpb11 dimerisation domain n=1 Tax=seawater metagenome TaxID=1561972 RepID=A0A5E8CIL4_9ZZZZ